MLNKWLSEKCELNGVQWRKWLTSGIHLVLVTPMNKATLSKGNACTGYCLRLILKRLLSRNPIYGFRLFTCSFKAKKMIL